jgi:ABC-type Fe3+ transport system permease subunit
MSYVLNHPPVVLVLALVLQWLAAYASDVFRERRSRAADAAVGDISTIVGATLTLLALLIGFCFAMAIDRYDQR